MTLRYLLYHYSPKAFNPDCVTRICIGEQEYEVS